MFELMSQFKLKTEQSGLSQVLTLRKSRTPRKMIRANYTVVRTGSRTHVLRSSTAIIHIILGHLRLTTSCDQVTLHTLRYVYIYPNS